MDVELLCLCKKTSNGARKHPQGFTTRSASSSTTPVTKSFSISEITIVVQETNESKHKTTFFFLPFYLVMLIIPDVATFRYSFM